MDSSPCGWLCQIKAIFPNSHSGPFGNDEGQTAPDLYLLIIISTVLVSFLSRIVSIAIKCGFQRLRDGLTPWLFWLGQYVNNQWETVLFNLTPGFCIHSLFSRVPDHTGVGFHMPLLLKLCLCFKIMRPVWMACSEGENGPLWYSIILGFGL